MHWCYRWPSPSELVWSANGVKGELCDVNMSRYVHVHSCTRRSIQIYADECQTVTYNPSIKQIIKTLFKTTSSVPYVRWLLSRWLLSNHYCMLYPSPCGYLKYLLYWQQSSRAEMTTPWQNCWLPQYAAWQTEIMQTLFACIVNCHESSITNLDQFDYCIWNHNGYM